MSKSLSIIIVCYNKWNFTKSCLNDLSKLSNTSHEIIVVDNASSDETSVEMKKFISEYDSEFIRFIKNDVNVFHSKACNQGYHIANGKSVLFLNNDIRVKSNQNNWTETIINACNSTNGLVGPTMGQLDNNLNFIKEANQQLFGNSYMSGWCVAAKKEVWDQLDIDGNGQIWNERFPMYFNDTDLSFRARKKKIPMTVISLPEAIHFGKVSAAQINVHKLYTEGRAMFLKQWSK